jgi:Uma2 family endonuclease
MSNAQDEPGHVRDTVSMSSTPLIPVSEYLHTSYEPDCDYIDGELQDRNWGELSHALLQGIIGSTFYVNRRAWGIIAGIAMRVQVAATRYRIPDVCVLRRSDPADDIVKTPPLICIEVRSPDDRMQRVQERFDDYARMGVEHLWLFDPIRRQAWVMLPDGSQTHVDAEFTVPDTPIRIVLAEVFAELDDMQSQG